jgi:hypothetical protein
MSSTSSKINSKKSNSIVLKTDLTYEIKNLSSLEQIQQEVGGYIESLPGVSLKKCVAYVDESGLMNRRQLNSWSWLLEIFGFRISYNFGGVMGNCVITEMDRSTKNQYFKVMKEIDDYKVEHKDDDDYDLDKLSNHIAKFI